MVTQIRPPSTMMPMDLQSAQTNIHNSAVVSGSIVQSRAILVEHIRIDSNRRYDDVQAALELLPQFDNRIRGLLRDGKIGRVRSELQAIQGDAHLIIFSIAAHGDWLQIVSGKRKAAQYVIGHVLVSTQMTRHRLAAGLCAAQGHALRERRGHRHHRVRPTIHALRPVWRRKGDCRSERARSGNLRCIDSCGRVNARAARRP